MLVSNEFLGDRTVQYTVRPATGNVGVLATSDDGDADGGADLFNMYVRLCDMQGAKQTNCVESLLLVGIDPGDDTNLIHWHDQETFYVAHNATDVSGMRNVSIQVAQPYVKMCRVQSNNTVACAEQPELNRLLAPSQ